MRALVGYHSRMRSELRPSARAARRGAFALGLTLLPLACAGAPSAAATATPSTATATTNTTTLPLDAHNSQRPGQAAKGDALPAPVQQLRERGYLVQPVVDFEALNTTARTATPKDAAVETQKPHFHVVANGTFYGGGDPVGPIVRDGALDTGGYAICHQRGGVARLRDGTIVVARTRGGTAAQVAEAFGATADNPVEEAMGGGALLIEGGRIVGDDDLRTRQNFKQGAGGIDAAQMRKTTHSLMGIRDGAAFHLWAKKKGGAELQQELHAAGFAAVVMFDGGNAGFYDDGATRSAARSPALLGLGITVR